MRQYIFLLSILFATACSSTEKSEEQNTVAKPENQKHTIKEGEYELKQYYFVMLTKGNKRTEDMDTAYLNDLQTKHLANIDSLAAEGKILVAGPFGDDGFWRGIFIFDCPTQQEVEQLLDTDPMISAGWLGYEVHPWWTAKNDVFK